MEDLNKDFWRTMMNKYPDEVLALDEWLELQYVKIIVDTRFEAYPPAFQLGLFLQYTMQHENKQDWFRTKNHGTVAEQISRWFEVEHRRNSEPEKKHSAYPVFL